jgi:Ser/Thr protein kinase RdoA (MazF antagonist)
VTLVLVTPDGRVVGGLPPFEVAVPWWQEAGPVARGARETFGIDVTVLRLLSAETPPAGGPITYLAEVAAPVAGARPWHGTLDDHPLRASWARPGGAAADLAWARGVLAEHGIAVTDRPDQVRAWNLSSLWRLPTADGAAWLKVVPPFFAHEGRLLERLEGWPVPRPIAVDGPRTLMPTLPGADLYEASGHVLLRMVTQLVELQGAWTGRAEGLLEIGLPDWRAAALIPALADLVERSAGELAAADVETLRAFVKALPERFAAIDACGIAETLVHGDFHPGNHRGDGASLVLLDWGDSGVGHPLLDQAAFLDRIPAGDVEPVRVHWNETWRRRRPGSDPERAASLLAPVAAARQALIYRGFLDRIEPSEHVYHASDPADWLTRTAALVRGPSGTA